MNLVLGTAEFNPEGYAGKPCPSKQEIIRILNLAWEGGIRILDTAEAYNLGWVKPYFGAFAKINKSRSLPLESGTYYHYASAEEARQGVEFASVYGVAQLFGLRGAIVPFNINSTAFLDAAIPRETYARSVFDRGRLLEQGYTVKDCLSFVMRHNLTGVIVGVSSEKELAETLKVWYPCL